MSEVDIKEVVRERYAEIARNVRAPGSVLRRRIGVGGDFGQSLRCRRNQCLPKTRLRRRSAAAIHRARRT